MINIIYEDNHLLVVEKPVNCLVQEDNTKDKDLLTILKQELKEKYQKTGNVYLGLVHRLDRMVGGVMVFAKTSKAASRLSEQIKKNQFTKTYYAVVEGNLKQNGTLIDNLEKDEKRRISFVSPSGKRAKLNYEVLANKENKTLLKIHLETGRHHQIRVQFSHAGYPLYGDAKYNKQANLKDPVALFAKELSFYHPITKELLTFSLKLPKRFPFSLFE